MKLNKTLLFFTLFISIFNTSYAQLIDKAFVKNIPDIILPALTEMNRFELVEYFKAGQVANVKNEFQKDVVMLDYDSVNYFISIKTAENSRFEMKLFPIKDKIDSTSYIIGVINTVCAPICSSYINFYDHKWNKLAVDFKVPTAIDWLKNKQEETYGVKIADVFKTSFIELSFDKKQSTIVLKNNSADLLSVEDKLLIKPFLVNEDKSYKIKLSNTLVIINQ